MSKLRKAAYSLVDEDFSDRPSRILNILILIMIGLSTVLVVLESDQFLLEKYLVFFEVLNMAVVAVFLFEYILRVWTCIENPQYSHPLFGRIRFMLSPMMLVDFIAIAPALIVGLGFDLRSFRLIRLLRMIRVLKVARYVTALATIKKVIVIKRHQLGVSLAFVALMLVITSSLMFEVEHDAQPEVFASIPATMWWAVASLTTVGYGDVYPKTTAGKILAGFVAILGVGLFAIPTGVLASGFSQYALDEHIEKRCPHCNELLD